jgi:hypothetical protein
MTLYKWVLYIQYPIREVFIESSLNIGGVRVRRVKTERRSGWDN